MNINDFEAPEFTPNWLEDIFEKQTKLIEKYADIEGMPAYPFSTHTHGGQKWFKDFMWRVTEEVGESYEAYLELQHTDDPEKKEAHSVHQLEELIDALHFLVELVILTGKDWKWAREQLDTAEVMLPQEATTGDAYWLPVYWLGMVGNTLKNKPWKQTEMPTDEDKFYTNLGRAFTSLFITMACIGADEKKIYDYYVRKNQVNQFRQRSAY